SSSEKEMFLKLISVSGVGPKMGITVLSNMKLEELAVNIATSDVKALSKVKGLGKKTAERIILELREKITAEETVADGETVKPEKENALSPEKEDAVIALMGLGFTRQECVNAMNGATESGANTIQEIVTYALKHIR
ncbi:MAG: Holliday junction branch migration protein RuvA, partial [Clostridia bacterium]|nr:Holliday junction branch migration protein RuvA [Clostridia bacterium]